MRTLANLKEVARRLRRDVVVVWLAARDPDTPWWVKALALAVAAYALSPIDLIPDFIPVLGLLDDLVLVPLGLMLVMRLLPPAALARARAQAAARERLPKNRWAGAFVLALWVACAAALIGWGWCAFSATSPCGGSR